MIAALVAVGSAFGACEYVTPDTAWVYKWKFSGKTTYGTKPAAVQAAASGVCGYKPGTGTTDTGACDKSVRTPASLKIEGYTWYCKPICGSATFEEFAEVNEIFWMKKPYKAAMAGGVATDISNIIGKKATKFEAFGVATFDTFVNAGATKLQTYTLGYAGLGKYDLKNSRVKCVKGNFAGYANTGVVLSADTCLAGFWDCATLTLKCGPTVAFGKWSAKFKKSASKKYLKGGKLPKVAKWALYLNAL